MLLIPSSKQSLLLAAVEKAPIDDYAKDGSKELFTKMHCVLLIEFLKNG